MGGGILKKYTAFLLIMAVLFTYFAPAVSAFESNDCYIADTQFYNSAPSQYALSLTPEEEDALLGSAQRYDDAACAICSNDIATTHRDTLTKCGGLDSVHRRRHNLEERLLGC